MLNYVLRGLVAALAVGGIVVSSLALKVHNMDPSLAPPCAVTEKWDCGTVNHSRYAVFPAKTLDEDPTVPHVHIPVSIFGIIGYSLIAISALFGWWWVLLQLAEIAVGAALLFSYLEAYVIDKWCIYCVWSQGLSAAILLVTIVGVILHYRSRQALRTAEV